MRSEARLAVCRSASWVRWTLRGCLQARALVAAQGVAGGLGTRATLGSCPRGGAGGGRSAGVGDRSAADRDDGRRGGWRGVSEGEHRLVRPSWPALRCRSHRPPPSWAPACSRLLSFRDPPPPPAPAIVPVGGRAIAHSRVPAIPAPPRRAMRTIGRSGHGRPDRALPSLRDPPPPPEPPSADEPAGVRPTKLASNGRTR